VSERQPVCVGLDVGTGSARALAVAADGTVVGRGAHPLDSRREAGRHEQDPASWWEAVAAACRAALDGVAADRVAGVATCATSGTIVLVDGGGRPCGAALMYDDGRAVSQARRLDLPASWALPKVHWLLEEDREARGNGRRLAHQADVITRALAGHAVPADASHALKSGYDAGVGGWPAHVTRELGDLLPDVVTPGTPLGAVCPGAAAQTALPAGTPIFAGMTDGCAAQIAAGALRPGDANSVLGTTLVLKGCGPRPIEDRVHGVYSHRAPDHDGGWLPGGASSSGAGVLAARFPGRDLDALGELAAAHERTRVLSYPLVSRGERFPFAAPDAEAFTIGVPADDGEAAASLLQGLALVERLCFEQLARLGAPAGGELSLTGGATRNRRWCQLRADALGRAARLPEQTESAFGMAILATAHTTGEPVAAAARRMSRTEAVFEPRAAMSAHLDEQFERLVEALRQRGWLAVRPSGRS
jgi:D-ribulokinase